MISASKLIRVLMSIAKRITVWMNEFREKYIASKKSPTKPQSIIPTPRSIDSLNSSALFSTGSSIASEIYLLKKEHQIITFGKRAFGLANSQTLVDWAISELIDGLDSPHLRILAGLSEPLDSLEVDRIFRYALKELDFQVPNLQVCRWQYVRFLVQKVLEADSFATFPTETFPMDILWELYDIEQSLQSCSSLWHWSSIYYAWEGLLDGTSQYYLTGATHENILELTKLEAAQFLKETENLYLLEPIIMDFDIAR